ncbi:hypothetical protein J4226_04845 [Candidatus Pacearchaeota archaeon]|nr:hypothetical protein [Candidatus Pacearchaeota archaeon]
MTILDKIIQMQKEGISDNEIMAQLQNEGIRPSLISDAFQQAKIKNAVSPLEEPIDQYQEQQMPYPQEMQPSIMPTQSQTASQPPIQYAPQPQEQYQQPQQQYDYYTPQPQAYSEQDYYPQQEGYGTETISEIAQQVVTESLDAYKSKVGDIASFKSQIQNKVNDIDDRLKRIENSIDRLQQAILGKIGEFGESSAMIHQDLDNLHGTMSKLMNPLIDNVNEMRKISKK